MRKAFIRSLTKLAAIDKRVILLTGDLGYLVIEEFVDAFPKQFVNVGVAEQNMVGIATGLAEAGFIPFVYSIAPFAVLRPFEFIRNGPVYHHLPVRIVGIGQGVEYGYNGHSHFGVDDVGVLRTQPGLTIVAPADDDQAAVAIERTHSLTGPIYFRLSKDTFSISELAGQFELGRAQTIGNGRDVLLISSGAITRNVMQAARLLRDQGLATTILIISSIAPPPVTDLVAALSIHKRAFTVESHYITSGIGSLVAEVVADNGLNTHLIRLGFDHLLNQSIGSAQFLHAANGLSAEKIALQVKQNLEENV